MNPNRPARLNRTVLAMLGLLLLLTGAFVFLVGRAPPPPSRPACRSAPTCRCCPTASSPPPGCPWVGLAAAVVVGLAALWWLVAQTARAPATGTWQLADDPRGGTTELDTATAAAPLAEEISTYAGVRAATARLAGAHQHPQLHMRVTAEDGASLPDLRHRIDELAVPRLVGALDLPALDADLVLRLTGR